MVVYPTKLALKKPTVIHCLLDGRFGGPQNYALSVSKKLKKKYNFQFVSSGKSSHSDFHLTCLRRHIRIFFVLDVLVNIFELYALTKKQKFNRGGCILHIHSYMNIAPLLFAMISGIPALFHFHEQIKQPRLFQCLSLLVKRFNSIHLANVSRNFSSDTEFADFVFLPCAIENDDFDRVVDQSSIEKWPAASKNSLKILMVGNLNPVKDHMTVFSAIKELNQPVSLVVVGAFLDTQQKYSNLLRSEIRKIHDLGNKIDVHLLGFRAQNQVKYLLSKSDIFLLSSKSEACPLTILEARKIGSLIISTDVGDVSLMLKNYKNKKLIPKESPSHLADALRSIKLRNEFAKTPFQGKDDWSIDTATKKLTRAYERLLQSKTK